MSEVSYSLSVYTHRGEFLGAVDRFDSLRITLTVNNYSTMQVRFTDGDYNPLWFANRDTIFEISRKRAGVSRLVGDTAFLLRKNVRRIESNGRRTTEITALSYASLLARRIVAYGAGSSYAQKTDYADDMMKAIVTENFITPTDTTRIMTGISCDADASAAPSVTKGFAHRNVLTVCQELAAASAQAGTCLYFDINNNAVFSTYTGYRGTDHSSLSARPVIFSPDFGNLADVTITDDMTGEANYIYVGGQGEGDDRAIQTASDADRIAAAMRNRIEAWRDAINMTTTAALTAEANAELRQRRTRKQLTATALDSDAYAFGLHWGFGDLVTVQAGDMAMTAMINSLSIAVQNGAETLTAGFDERGTV